MQQEEISSATTLEDHLKALFGYNAFRHCQRDIVTAILERRDVLAILPTGAGKSICYQLPAMLMPGLAIVVSPLISLMQDQVVSLSKNGLPAAFLNSSLHFHDMHSVLNNLSDYKLLYVAPERLADQNFIQRLKQVKVSFFAIDEAHCISQWGHSFRPEYRQLSFLKTTFPESSVIALTATATPEVEKDIAVQLAMKSPHLVKASFDRPNLTLRINSKTNSSSQLREFLDKHPNESGIIYASTRKTVDNTYEVLKQLGYNVGKYHAGMTDDERTKAQHDFVYGQVLLMVATVAFGMGIHKPDIRFIAHADMPRSIEQYYQEIGRAGRDGLPAECLMLYSYQDMAIYNSFLTQVTDEVLRKLTKAKTQKMFSLCNSNSCRRKELLRYFGEKSHFETCHGCDNCLDDVELVDETIVAQKILSCVFRLQERFGVKHVIDVLRGSKSKPVISKGHDALSTYGLMAEYTETDLRYYIDAIIRQGFLRISEGEYPIVQWTPSSRSVVFNGAKVMLRKKTWQPNSQKDVQRSACNMSLYHVLSALRLKWATETNVPAYVVFGDRSLIEMATVFPLTADDFLEINGVGPLKWERYGQSFINAIKQYCDENQIVPLPIGRIKPKVQSKPIEKSKGLVHSQTASDTLMLFKAGNNIEQMAKMRGLAASTIISHLVEHIMHGIDLDINPLVTLEKREAISKVIAEVGVEKLAPIRERLPEEITYGEINLVAAFHRRKQ